MTKRLLIMFVILLITLMTVGCGRNAAPGPGNQPSSVPQPTNPIQPAPNSSTLIGEDKAKEIALERAGITEDRVRFDRVELDRDSGVLHYEVEFFKDNIEYDADIKADDGTVLSFEADYRD